MVRALNRASDGDDARGVALPGDAAIVYRRVPRLVSRRLRDTVIVSRPDHQVARLEGAAALVWDALDTAGRSDEVVARSRRQAGHGWEDLAAQVEAAIDLLVDGGLVAVDVGPVAGPDRAGAPGGAAASGTASDPATRPTGAAPVPDGTGARLPAAAEARPHAAGVDAGSVDGVLAQVAGWLLPGAPPIAPLTTPTEADLLVDRATTLRLLGPLLAAVDAGALELAPSLVERVVARHEDSLLWCLHLEVRLLEIRRQLDDAGVPFLLTKGAAVARLDEVDPSLRSFVDLDLLVPGADIDRAIDVLAAHGARRAYLERRPGFDRRFVKSVTLTCPDDVEIDVHRTLCDGTHGFRIPVERLHAEATTFGVGGEEVRTLSRVHRALHAAYHGVLGSATPPLRTVRDVAAYIAAPDLPPEVLAAEAAEWRGEAVLAEAVRAAFETFDLDAPRWREWLADVVVDRREADIVARQRVESGSFGRAKLTALRELGWSDRLAYATAVALPTTAHLRSRGVRRADVVATASRRVRGAARDGLGRARERRR